MRNHLRGYYIPHTEQTKTGPGHVDTERQLQTKYTTHESN